MTERQPTSRLRLLFALTTLGSLIVAACGGGASPSPTGAAPTGATGAPSEAPSEAPTETEKPSMTIAFSSLGYNTVVPLEAVETLRAAGYEIETAIMDASELSVQGVADGQFQFGASGNSTALIAMQASDGRLKFVGDELANEWSLYARNDFQTCESLDGKRVGIFSEGGVSTAMVRNYFENQCPGTEPQYLVFGDSATRAAALIAGELDATPVELSDALTLESQAGDEVHQLSSFAEDLPNLKTTSFYGHTPWMAEHPEAVKDFLRAVIEQARMSVDDPDYYAQLVDKHYPDAAEETKEGAIEAYTTGGFLPVNGGLTEEDLQYTIDFFTDAGVLEGELTVDQAADLSYLDAVLEEIGRQ
jgi:NitT/TauT family transport system substrate-binding protein